MLPNVEPSRRAIEVWLMGSYGADAGRLRRFVRSFFLFTGPIGLKSSIEAYLIIGVGVEPTFYQVRIIHYSDS